MTIPLLVCGLGAAAPPAWGQGGSATANVTASVFLQPITVTATADLAFGQVVPGIPSTVAATAPNAGAFSIQSAPGLAMTLSFTLPTALTSGANTLPIGTWTGYFGSNPTPTGGTTFDPTAGFFTGATSGQRYTFVGATVAPAPAQPSGDYLGQIMLTVNYF